MIGRDTPGHRCLMGVAAPATNTVLQPEMEALCPGGVINAHARTANPEQRVAADADTLAVRAAMVGGLMAALGYAGAGPAGSPDPRRHGRDRRGGRR